MQNIDHNIMPSVRLPDYRSPHERINIVPVINVSVYPSDIFLFDHASIMFDVSVRPIVRSNIAEGEICRSGSIAEGI